MWEETVSYVLENGEDELQKGSDFFEAASSAILVGSQWDCCDCWSNIYTETTQCVNQATTVYSY